MKKYFLKNLILFIIGCSLYLMIEIFFRGYSFRAMGITGGIIFILGGLINNKFSWKIDLLLQCFIISFIITIFEAIIGNIDFYFLHLNMWNYSNMPFNLLNAKICLPFSIIWFFIGFVIVFVNDAITYYWLHDGDQPEYYIFGKRIFCMPVRKCSIVK